jgi:hypothetical protein
MKTSVYNETSIAHALARTLFKSDLVVVDNCMWPGAECDLLVVTKNLRVIDVEVKISRADLKADRDKAKWFTTLGTWRTGYTKERRAWPRKVWKHYYAMPAELYTPALLELCNPASGVITVQAKFERGEDLAKSPRWWLHDVVRRAKPCRDNEPLSASDAVDIARLASLRMWDAYAELQSRVAGA